MNTINTLLTALGLFSALSSGLLAGALLTEAFILVPYWRKMHAREFLSLHHTMGPSLFRFFAPITIAGTTLPIAVVICAWQAGDNLHWWSISAVSGVCMLSIYFAYFKAANDRFAKSTVHEQDLPIELSRWANWHSLRTVIAVAGFIAALLAVRDF